ncbi:exported hypothetical protein [Streptomyces misionensis JCM 4497]
MRRSIRPPSPRSCPRCAQTSWPRAACARTANRRPARSRPTAAPPTPSWHPAPWPPGRTTRPTSSARPSSPAGTSTSSSTPRPSSTAWTAICAACPPGSDDGTTRPPQARPCVPPVTTPSRRPDTPGATGKPFLYIVVCAARVAAGVEELIAAAQERGRDAGVIATPVAMGGFFDAGAVRALTGRTVRSAWRTPTDPRPFQAADTVVVAPATSDTGNKWAAGIADTLAISTLCEAAGLGVPIAVLPLRGRRAGHPPRPPGQPGTAARDGDALRRPIHRRAGFRRAPPGVPLDERPGPAGTRLAYRQVGARGGGLGRRPAGSVDEDARGSRGVLRGGGGGRERGGAGGGRGPGGGRPGYAGHRAGQLRQGGAGEGRDTSGQPDGEGVVVDGRHRRRGRQPGQFGGGRRGLAPGRPVEQRAHGALVVAGSVDLPRVRPRFAVVQEVDGGQGGRRGLAVGSGHAARRFAGLDDAGPGDPAGGRQENGGESGQQRRCA